MKPRSRATGAGKTRRRKRARPKPHSTQTRSLRRISSAASLHKKVALLARERDEALEQQKATAEVLQVISASPGELEPVFQTILSNATRICEAKFGTLYLYDGEAFHAASLFNAPPAYAEKRPIRPQPGTGLGRRIDKLKLHAAAAGFGSGRST
jgi:hypothetical protein